MIFTRLPAFQCTWFPWLCLSSVWDKTGRALSSFSLLLFGGDFFGPALFELLTQWGGRISPAWQRDNDLAHPRMVKITIYHVQLRSELLRTKFRTKLCNVIGFVTDTYFACTRCVLNSMGEVFPATTTLIYPQLQLKKRSLRVMWRLANSMYQLPPRKDKCCEGGWANK